jgi:phytanoyl-CoA hydroxylase
MRYIVGITIFSSMNPSVYSSAPTALSAEQIDCFNRDGFLVLPQHACPETCTALSAVSEQHLTQQIEPLEYEADLGYPGAPAHRGAEGGMTVRRLRGIFQRDEVFRAWALSSSVCTPMMQLLGEPLSLTLAHHNAVMTKHPHFGTATGWHRDNRYWAFTQPQLITAWLALGPEDVSNGALHVIPGSHAVTLAPGQLDALSFLVESHPDSAALVAGAVEVSLQAGDVLFFDSRLFHSAGRNTSERVKMSVAFTYFGAGNHPVPGSRTEAGGSVSVGESVSFA